MDGIRSIARAYYERASEDEKASVEEFFDELDANGNGEVSLREYRNTVKPWLSDEAIFRQLDANGDGVLDFNEVIALHYLEEKVTLCKCDGCRVLLAGPYFSCLLCLENGDNSTDLCCSCYRGGRFAHVHDSSNFLDHHALLMLFRARTRDAHLARHQREMEELHDIAEAHYEAGTRKVQALAHDFFDSMDTNGDESVSLTEFLAFLREEGYPHWANRPFFDELDRDGDGTLDFLEVMTLYYIIKSGRPFCSWCGNFIPGIFFSCVECYKNPRGGGGGSFNLCRVCYVSKRCNHGHNGRVQFLDNYTLLETRATNSSPAQTSRGPNPNEPRATTTQARSPIPPNAIVHAAAATNSNLYASATWQPTYNNTYNVVNHSTAIVPAAPTRQNKWRTAYRAFEVALSVGAISTTMCAIL